MDKTRKYQDYIMKMKSKYVCVCVCVYIYIYHTQLFAYNYHKNDKERHYKCYSVWIIIKQSCHTSQNFEEELYTKSTKLTFLFNTVTRFPRHNLIHTLFTSM